MPAAAPVPAHLFARRVEVGRRIKAARKRARLSQPGLAELVGCDFKTISRIETGAVSPRLDRLFEIADALGVPVASLVPGGPPPPE
ncbi:helix-turn-helix transcriptional regulator [Streptomyces sp. DSM 44917]|uniref:Helix-turn-helix transcriptional regulator n=1 Tax=Streptomyces boetiae TaxID=3075541 RepID=A0ABU2L5P8_9ACTN|nr:helix-turn-helix transcriptional regulator [Streptomyces sp. DSM 44917]MDT0306887.1 helix-turn-helix transcriptional regulator [Streptomyces sp. DSM 44917]